MAINQLNKYVWLVETIHRARKRGGITLKEIQSRWKDSDLSEGTVLSRRTFINNLHSIEELFEISICCGSGYRYYIEYGDCFEEGSARSWMLNAFSLNAMVGNSHKLKERVLLEDMPSGRNYLEDIIKAMRDNRVISISYYSFNTEEYHEFDIHPYFVKAFKNVGMWWLTVLAQMTSDAMRSTVWRMSPSLKKHSNCQRIWILLNISRIASASSTTRILMCKRWYSKWMHSKATISATFLSIPHKRKRSAQMSILSLNTI